MNEVVEPAVARPAPKRALLGVVAAVLVSVVAIASAAAFSRAKPSDLPAAPGMSVGSSDVTLAPGAAQWKSLRVAAAVTPADHWSEAVPARIRIDETRAARVGTPLSGRVTRVSVELGQRVKAGDPLFTVASPDLAQLRVEREKAHVDLAVAKKTLARVQDLVSAKLLAGKDEIEARQQERQAALALRVAGAKLASLKVSVRGENEFTVVSPVDGVVVLKDLLPSQEVTPDAVLVEVADLTEVWVVANLFEDSVIGIGTGTPVKVSLPAMSGFEAKSEVATVSSVVDPAQHSVPVRVHLPNPGEKLRPNMYAEMRFEVKPPGGAAEVAATALVSDGEHQYVYVEAPPGHFVRRTVTAGSARNGRVPVLSGLAVGESVVEEGAILLDNQIDLSN